MDTPSLRGDRSRDAAASPLYGALGPRSALRRAVSSATRGLATCAELEAGYVVTVLGAVARAAYVRRIFEVDPVLCVKCGGEMVLAAIILDDGE